MSKLIIICNMPLTNGVNPCPLAHIPSEQAQPICQYCRAALVISAETFSIESDQRFEE